MPNGGSDCCATCWFNSTHEGQAGYFRLDTEQEVRCVIRGTVIQVPHWTYCVNHPHHNPSKISSPIGPIYVDSGGFPYRRELLKDAIDTTEIRAELLRLLDQMPERPPIEYPTSPKFDDAVVLHVMQIGEKRAIPGLRRVCRFDPLATPEDEDAFGENRIGTVAYAVEALGALAEDDALTEISTALAKGRDEALRLDPYEANKDLFLRIRYHAVKALRYSFN
jgi:hypothetical protein